MGLGRRYEQAEAGAIGISWRAPMTESRFIYLHGFASSPASRKARALVAAFAGLGHVLEVPDLNVPSFGKLSLAAMIAALDALYEERGIPMRIVGSSLGGWLAARYSELHPERVDRLVLLCPGFHLAERWPKVVGEEWFAVWEKHGELALPDVTGQKVPVHWGFIEEARREPPDPAVSCPTVIIHGARDEVVPLRISREYVAEHPLATLIEVDDTHDLAASIERIDAEVQRHFGVGRPTWKDHH